MVCFNCDEEGHISSQCKKPKKAQASGKLFALTGTQTVNEDRLIRVRRCVFLLLKKRVKLSS